MPPEVLPFDEAARTSAAPIPQAWRKPLVRLALAWAALILLTWRDWAAMADLWWNVSTYNHIVFVPPIVAWLVWLRRFELALLTPTGCWPGLAGLSGALFLWLLGGLAGVNIAGQLGAVVAMLCAVLALLGPRVGAALVFPLGYTLFLVPFGDELVPALQMITAKMTIALTLWSGIPAHIDGVFIDTPVGLFEVAEACSGVQFLVAMAAFAALVAHVCFATWRRRIVFLAVAMALPILANGVRAWGTIYIAQSQGIAFAVGFDHIFYGWVFFALVIALLLAASWRWLDREPDAVPVDAGAIAANATVTRLAALAMPGNVVLAAAAALALAFALWLGGASRVEASLPERLSAPAVAGWSAVPVQQVVAWEPRASGANLRELASYRDASGRTVEVFLAAYAAQDNRRDVTGDGEGALVPDTSWRWLADGPAVSDARSVILMGEGGIRRLAQTSYRTGDLTTTSAPRMKLAVMRDRILLDPQPAMILIVSGEGDDPVELAERLGRFAVAMGDRGEWMDRAAGLR
jgi:exosortase A